MLFFILCFGNCGAPLTLNFIGEFLSLYGAFERSPILGVLASSSIVFSAAYTIYMFNRIAFAGSYSKFFKVNIPDLNKREFTILLTLVYFHCSFRNISCACVRWFTLFSNNSHLFCSLFRITYTTLIFMFKIICTTYIKTWVLNVR